MSTVRSAAGFWRHSDRDALLVGLSLVHAALVVTVPSVPLIAIGLWWNANTVSHNFIHTPFFRRSAANGIFSIYLSLVLGVPQRLWRARHLVHHAERDGHRRTIRPDRMMVVEAGVVLGLWSIIGATTPAFFVSTYLPGWLLGLGLCQLQGYFEHADGTSSHYGWLYNVLFFNDGYHVEHHARPGVHWTRLRRDAALQARESRWPPVLRWLERPRAVLLTQLERLVLHLGLLQRFVLTRHERALRTLLSGQRRPRRVLIVGGGLFPRTAMLVRRILPNAMVTIVDANERHLDVAKRFISHDVEWVHARYEPPAGVDADLLIVPLAFDGDRGSLYAHPPASLTIVHDWIWRPRGRSVRVSWLLLKRLNLIEAPVRS